MGNKISKFGKFGAFWVADTRELARQNRAGMLFLAPVRVNAEIGDASFNGKP
jgi:hypothetical protein